MSGAGVYSSQLRNCCPFGKLVMMLVQSGTCVFHVVGLLPSGQSHVADWLYPFVTPFAVRTRELDQRNLVSLGLLGFLQGDRFSEDTGLYPLETPVTDKIPVVFVHGLLSEPNTWRFLHAALLADPLIRQRYQFLAFQYPVEIPGITNSYFLQASVNEIRKSRGQIGRAHV